MHQCDVTCSGICCHHFICHLVTKLIIKNLAQDYTNQRKMTQNEYSLMDKYLVYLPQAIYLPDFLEAFYSIIGANKDSSRKERVAIYPIAEMTQPHLAWVRQKNQSQQRLRRMIADIE